MEIPQTITCVDCGQTAHLLSRAPEGGWRPGDFAAYRCAGCNDRWDLVVEDPAEARPYQSLSERRKGPET
ncbi:hypothetical protein BH23VER1_BH23VER1_03150 [soil metagenome]